MPPIARAALVLAAFLVLASPRAGASVPTGYEETVLVASGGLSRPVALAVAPDGRIFVGEQYTGKIRVVKDGRLLPEPFATIQPVYTNGNELGLLGLCLAPDFATTGELYAFVTQTSSVQRVIRFRADGDTGRDPTVVVDALPTRGVNHNGGGIAFGPDGKLYVSVGDNADGPSAQNLLSQRGKLLRFERDGSVPADNPFPGSAVYALGLRNTFRFCFQPGTGKIFGTENGPSTDDELNVLRRGASYGWPGLQGRALVPGFEDPILVWTPTIAPAGIAFRAGSLLVADYKEGKVLWIVLGGPEGESVLSVSDFVTGASQVVDLALAPDGALVYCTLDGVVARVASAGGNEAPRASIAATPERGAAPLSVALDASASSDPDGRIVSFAWSFSGGIPDAVGPVVSVVLPAPGTYTVTLSVTDDGGATATTRREIVVSTTGSNAPPSAHIERVDPASGPAPLRVRATGHGHDDGRIVRHEYDWGDGSPVEVVVPASGTDGVNTTVEHTFGLPGSYSVRLTVTDDQGATGRHEALVAVTGALSGGGGGGGKSGCALGAPGSPGSFAPSLFFIIALLAWKRSFRAR